MRASSIRESILEAVGDRVDRATLCALLPEIFMASELKLVEDRWAGQPFEIHPMIRDNFIRPLFGTLNDDGTRLYTEAIIEMARKWSKTTTIAGLAQYFMLMEPVPGQIVATVAYDEDQARKSLNFGKQMVENSPKLRKIFKPYADRLYIPENDSMWRVFPHNADDVQGEGVRVAIFEEPHTYKSIDTINGVRSGMGAREEPIVIGVTTPGPNRKGVLWDWIHGEYDPEIGMRTGGILEDPRGFYFRYGARDDEDIEDRDVWRKYNAPWVTMDYLEDMFRRLTRRDFERYHLARWPKAGRYTAAISPSLWGNEANSRPPQFDSERGSVMAIDAADKKDRTAFATVQVDSNGDYNVWCEVRFADRERDYTDYLALENDLKETATRSNVERMGFDRRQMGRTMSQLQDEGFPVEEFPQSNENMCAAAAWLYELAASGRLRHGGDPVLAEHVANAVQYDRPPIGWRFAKADRNDPDCKIDAVIATAMACWMAQATKPKRRSFVETGGFHSVAL